ncbi:MAG: MlaA family lipoprotein [Granulosicoccaceae bacterium]
MKLLKHAGAKTIALTLVLTLCVPPLASAEEVYDPFEKFNRKVQRLNDVGDKYVIKPAAQAYKKATPRFFRTGVRNFLNNLSYPVVIGNQFLQGKFALGMDDTARFLLNTTIGVGGILDVATPWGLPAHDEDFGQTFAKWGMKPGPYMVFPIWGGVTLRSGLGDIPDLLLYPPTYTLSQAEGVALSTFWTLNRRVELSDAENLLSGDRYIFFRDAYLQQREYLAADGEIEDSFLD